MGGSTSGAFEMTPCGNSENFGSANSPRIFFKVGAIFVRAFVASFCTFASCFFLAADAFLSSPGD